MNMIFYNTLWLVPKLKIKLGIENISGNFDCFLHVYLGKRCGIY